MPGEMTLISVSAPVASILDDNSRPCPDPPVATMSGACVYRPPFVTGTPAMPPKPPPPPPFGFPGLFVAVVPGSGIPPVNHCRFVMSPVAPEEFSQPPPISTSIYTQGPASCRTARFCTSALYGKSPIPLEFVPALATKEASDIGGTGQKGAV